MNRTRVYLTEEQSKRLQPLFDELQRIAETEGPAMVLAQIWSAPDSERFTHMDVAVIDHEAAVKLNIVGEQESARMNARLRGVQP